MEKFEFYTQVRYVQRRLLFRGMPTADRLAARRFIIFVNMP